MEPGFQQARNCSERQHCVRLQVLILCLHGSCVFDLAVSFIRAAGVHEVSERDASLTPHVLSCRIGEGWSDKKSICNKFVQNSPVTCLVWPRGREDVVFGLSDGKVKLGQLKTNKPLTMYAHPDSSYVVSLASSPDGHAVISGHLDGSIYRFTFPSDDGSHGQGIGHVQLATHSCVPYALGWGNAIAAAGNDNRVRVRGCIAAGLRSAGGLWARGAQGTECSLCVISRVGVKEYRYYKDDKSPPSTCMHKPPPLPPPLAHTFPLYLPPSLPLCTSPPSLPTCTSAPSLSPPPSLPLHLHRGGSTNPQMAAPLRDC